MYYYDLIIRASIYYYYSNLCRKTVPNWLLRRSQHIKNRFEKQKILFFAKIISNVVTTDH